MAYDEDLAGRVRSHLARRTDADERRMFGGLAFLIGGHMCCGVNGDELIVRVDPDRTQEALADPHARPMDFTGRPLRGFVTVRPSGLEGDGLERWVRVGVARAESLPPKSLARPLSAHNDESKAAGADREPRRR